MNILNKIKESLKNETTKQQQQTDIFSSIVGHNEIKNVFNMALQSEQPVHVLLVGPPGVGKTQFVDKIMGHMKEKAYFTLGSHSTKAGMLNQLFEQRPRYLCVDEIEHMPATDQTVLLSLMQDGTISETKVKKTRQTTLKTWVFATCNNSKKLSHALLSRFVVINVQKYTKKEFVEIANKVLVNNENVDPDLAVMISSKVYDNFKNANMRDTIKIGRMAKNINDVERLVEIMSNNE